MKLFVGNLSFRTTEEGLRDRFAQQGREVVSVQISSGSQVGHAQGYGFVTMATDADGRAAIEALDGAEFNGRTLSVSPARVRPDTKPSSS